MKKNTRTYTLLALVLIVWGILGFRIVKTISPDETAAPAISTNKEFRPLETGKKDSFGILANYRDPFLGTLPKSPSSNKRINKSTKNKKPSLPDKNITYSGWVNDRSTKEKIFFLDVDGQQLMLTKKQKQEGVQLLSGNEDKIRVRYNGLTKTIKRKQ